MEKWIWARPHIDLAHLTCLCQNIFSFVYFEFSQYHHKLHMVFISWIPHWILTASLKKKERKIYRSLASNYLFKWHKIYATNVKCKATGTSLASSTVWFPGDFCDFRLALDSECYCWIYTKTIVANENSRRYLSSLCRLSEPHWKIAIQIRFALRARWDG
jgi:hypothetical protein